MQTAETISELHARLTEARMRVNNLSWQNNDLKQDVIERDNTIKSLKSKEQRMEKQLELADEKKRVVCAELFTVTLALRGMEQQVDRLKSEIRSLTNGLTSMKEGKQERDVEVSMLNAEMQQYKTNMERNKSRISDLCRENKILKTQLEANAQRYRETLEQGNMIGQLKQSLDHYLLYKDQFLQNLRYCKDCHSTQQKLKELERIQRDYNQMKEENEELMFRAEENKRLKNKIMREEADYPKKIGLRQNEIETKALEIVYHRVLTNSNPGTQKRQSEERNESQGKKPRNLGNDRPPRKVDNSPDFDPGHHCRAETPCRPDHATSYNDQSSSRMTSTPLTTSQSRSPDLRTFTVVADVNPIPLKYSSPQPSPSNLKTIEQETRTAEGEADTDKADSIDPILNDLSDIRNSSSDTSSDTSIDGLKRLEDYLVTKNSNASQNQTAKRDHPTK
ncbi:interaptin-like isoform X2 [Bradysia coprophila]|uniref:interaptin-like isoform X2 n=1 Tax=Bradysia coprophila TaxID=38358 RepID=UPI00187D9BBA|nr:interaptin-like isoform X2 [Bradysia coprophila]